MSATAPGRAWDDASGVASDEPVRRFESAWRKSAPGRRPDPLAFVGDGSPGVRLALLRSELGMRWESGERAGAERYRGLGLSDDSLVALVYEEFCLREDHGESPEPSRFYERFPEIAAALKRVLDIHDLVGSGRATSMASLGLSPCGAAPPFPEAGQTIGGFHLVEELGRGGFARVFLARERQLGDRPVALKVARSGSREPQTLARLQHTHIVPVHSYRIDPATGLHLLCMPYFGRVTLAHVLADKAVKTARTGAEVVAALDRLDREGAAGSSARPAGRMALAARPYARAIAWWGARLAEALQHAHDRGVLHRDVKPSNVLVTADGMPMLLDFNLAHGPLDVSPSDETPAALGGTVAYMSPEHLEALAEGRSDGVDARSDIYALGVILYEAMGSRPFGPPPSAKSIPESLLRAAEDRRARVPGLRDAYPETPAALVAVVARCLAPDPDDRYASALDLAEDLQAVADDLPLPHAREPIVVRVLIKVRRHRRAMAATAAVLLALGLAGFVSMNSRMAGERLRDQIRYSHALGLQAFDAQEFGLAAQHFETEKRLSQETPDLVPVWRQAQHWAIAAGQAERISAATGRFLADADALKLALLGFDADRPGPVPSLEAALSPFFVLNNPDWTALDELEILGPERRNRLIREVHETLFLGAIRAAASADPKERDLARRLCNTAASIRKSRGASSEEARSLPEGPWEAVRRYLDTGGASRCTPPSPSGIASSWECYQWGRLLLLEQRRLPRRAAPWLDEAARREVGKFWLEYDVAYQADRAGPELIDAAIEHYSAAIELRPGYPRALANRARLFFSKGALARARADLDQALTFAPDLVSARLDLGLVHQALGDLPGAMVAYGRVLADPNAGAYRRAALLNGAKIDFDLGRAGAAAEALDRLLAQDPEDHVARIGRASVALRTGDLASAEAALDRLLRARPRDAEALTLRALARLRSGKADAAEADASLAARIDPTPRRDRLHARALLALGRSDALDLDDPGEIRLLPVGGPALASDLRAAAEALRRGELSAPARSSLPSILCALGDPDGAEAEATRAIERMPLSPRARSIRARIRRDRGDRAGALADVAAGLEREPDDPRLLGLRGRLLMEMGDPSAALAALGRASRRSGGPALDRPLAEARTRLGFGQVALTVWNRVLDHDPDDPSAYLGRARAFLSLGEWDQALADLERAADRAGDRADVLAPLVLTYARCLPARPGHWGRVLALARRGMVATQG